jgi:hypothetical protein
MRRLQGVAVLVAVAALVTASVAYGTTQRRVRGIITAVDPANVTISPVSEGHRPCITGRIDPTRTRVIVDGRPGRATDLRVTENARAELSLDEVWMTIRVDSR